MIIMFFDGMIMMIMIMVIMIMMNMMMINRMMLNYDNLKEGSDYINASWIPGFLSLTEFIMSQHPKVNKYDEML